MCQTPCKTFPEFFIDMKGHSSMNFHWVHLQNQQLDQETTPWMNPPSSHCPLKGNHYPDVSLHRCFLKFNIFWTFYSWNRTECALLCLASFTQQGVCEIHPYCCTSLESWHSCWWAFGLFPVSMEYYEYARYWTSFHPGFNMRGGPISLIVQMWRLRLVTMVPVKWHSR